MNGLNPMYDTVTRHQHEQDMRRASEFRLIRDARRRNGSIGLFAKIASRFTGSNEATVECAHERTARTVN